MENVSDIGIGAGLAVLAFWLFLSAIILGGIWDNIRKREAQHETVRRIIESGQDIDREVFDKLLSISDGKYRRVDRDFKLAGLVLIPVALGVAVLGIFIGSQYGGYLGPLSGVAALIGCLALGFLAIGKHISSWYSDTGGNDVHTQD